MRYEARGVDADAGADVGAAGIRGVMLLSSTFSVSVPLSLFSSSSAPAPVSLSATTDEEAAAGGDFSENAPLDAARENQGKNEGRIREIEDTLKKSRVMDSKSMRKRGRSAAFVGSTIVIKNKTTNKQNSYMLVESSESNPKEGKLSIQSPIGKAIYGMAAGSEVEIRLPSGESNLFYLSNIK